MTDTFDKLFASRPVNKLAARVSGGGVHWNPQYRPSRQRSDTPIPMRPFQQASTNVDLTGKRIGKLTVMGVSAIRASGGARWVVRCVCGAWEVRSAKAIQNSASNGHDSCNECGYWWHLKRRQVFDRTGKWPDDRGL